jgi:oligopeptidase B
MTFTHKFHSREIKDPHHWLKDQSKQKAQPIMDYLNKENEFYKINMHSHSALIEQIYSETLKKIKEDDDTVPVKKGDYYYFQKTVKNKQYPLHCRSLFGAQETLLDLNTWDYEYISLGHFKISPNHQLLAFSVDLNGSELYSIYFKDLVTGELLSDETILNCAGNIEWFKDNRTVVYNTVDAAHRSDKLWKHELFSGKADSLLLDESDPKFILEPFVSLSGEFILMCSQSSLTTEFHYLPTDSPNSDPVLFLRREYKHRYMLEHQGSGFIIVTDGAGEFLNSRLCHCPLVNCSNIE